MLFALGYFPVGEFAVGYFPATATISSLPIVFFGNGASGDNLSAGGFLSNITVGGGVSDKGSS